MALDLQGFDDFARLDRDKETVVKRLKMDSEEGGFDLPYQMTDVDMWVNYCNQDLYELDKEVRRYIKRIRYTRMKKGKFKTAVPFVFSWIFHRAPLPDDGQVCRILHRLLDYYATRTTGMSAIGGRKMTHVYHFSKYAGDHKRPYSLRLRLEEMEKEGRDGFPVSSVRDQRYVGRSNIRDCTKAHGIGGEEG